MSAPVRITRRSFLVGLNLSLGGLALGLTPWRARANEPEAAPGEKPFEPSVFIHIAENGVVTIVCHRSEMGQGIRSSIPVLIADELGADPARVVVRQADGDQKYGDQNTDGSKSIRGFYEDLRRVGASARTVLIAAAARRWKVDPRQCEAHDNAVVHVPTKRRASFAELIPSAVQLPLPKPDQVTLRPRRELVHVNDPNRAILDAPAYVTGKAIFGADVTVPGMLIAIIARPPVVGATVKHVDSTRALAVPGVKKVIAMPAPKRPYAFQPWGGVAVVAENTWAAMRGCAALQIDWDPGDNGDYDSTAFRTTLLESVRKSGQTVRNVGDVDAALAKAARIVEAEYTVPHLAQMPMEPPVAMARFDNGRCEIWAATQNPQDARKEAARVLGIDEDHVTIHVTLLGGGFGRKSKADFVSEAAFLAREAGAPVRVQWTREDDVRHSYYNTVSAQRFRAGLDGAGKLVAWHQRTAFPPIPSTFGNAPAPTAADLQQGVLDLALDAPNVRAEACPAPAHVRIGWYRSVYNIFHGFAAGSFIDEIAAARNADPREVWLEVIGPARTLGLRELGVEKLVNYGETLTKHPVDAGRLRNVVEHVTAAAGWRGRHKEGRAFGLAAHRSFVAYTAVVLAVVPDARRGVRVDEAWICMDAGIVVNAERVRSQMEGAVVMGISNALYGGITMKKGATVQSNFRDARIARVADAPRRVHTEVIVSDAAPCGVGEPGVPPVGAALANALFALTGRRVRDLPIANALGV
jgi:isoquinoline 1-oxidoreductase beta subunit